MTEIKTFVPSAVHKCRFYEQAWSAYLDLKEKMEALLSKYASELELQEQLPSQYQDIKDNIKMLQKKLHNNLYCLDDLGIVCAYENVPDAKERCQFYRECSSQLKIFLEEVLLMIARFLQPGMPIGCELHADSQFDYTKACDLGFISLKL
ncbi:endoribonuclease Dicer homolog 3a-like [Pyrus x bretschneideri]|uniref:endoribonuclease Dicer homolog 3a-like n=1 Tax=Pyrus x bretschneideri TaxID=225117 RepID=UPI00202EA8CB|nr:endoribonuclease Dicer homolog 3a-like [Pyrus x bretschneideri]